MESTKKKRTWAGYACPVCRFVFRVSKESAGVGVICPACQHLLNVPESNHESRESNPAEHHEVYGRKPLSARKLSAASIANTPKQEEETEGLVSRPLVSADASPRSVPVAKDWNAASPELGQQRALSRSRSREENSSWDRASGSSQPESGQGSSVAMIVGGSLLGLAVVGVGAWFVMGSLDSGKRNQRAVSETAADLLPAEPVVQLTEDEQNLQDEIESSVSTGMNVMVESEEVVRAFLTAEKFEDLSGLVRTPDVTVPRMREWYASHQWVAPGVKQVCSGGKVTTKGVMASMSVQLDDYSIKPIAMERTPDGYLIDWESWVAWSEMDWEDLFKKRPTQSVEVRVVCQKDSYYNRFFRDEGKWLAVKMECPGADRSLYGYIDSKTTTLTSLMGDLKSGGRVPVTIKIRFPEGSVADNQVIIEEYIQHGWVRPSESDELESDSPSLSPKLDTPSSHE